MTAMDLPSQHSKTLSTSFFSRYLVLRVCAAHMPSGSGLDSATRAPLVMPEAAARDSALLHVMLVSRFPAPAHPKAISWRYRIIGRCSGTCSHGGRATLMVECETVVNEV
jgi:hypothetical protein